MKRYVKKVVLGVAFVALLITPTQHAHAGIIEVIKQIIIKVIKEADLKVQKMQNKTIGLQNAQKELENKMTKLKLKQISEWTEKQKEQYQKYFDELQKVKSVIKDYQTVSRMIQLQKRLVDEHTKMWTIIKSDRNFKPSEIQYMERVYTGMLNQSLQNVKQLQTIITSNKTKMSDGKRLEMIDEISVKIQRNYNDLRSFNTENSLLSVSRSKDVQDAQRVKRLYGIN